MAALCQQDRDVLAIWSEHGIPLDATTLHHASEILTALTNDLDEAWRIVFQLLNGNPLVCAGCATEIQPTLPLGAA